MGLERRAWRRCGSLELETMTSTTAALGVAAVRRWAPVVTAVQRGKGNRACDTSPSSSSSSSPSQS
ncbi:hypothetical protein E2562_005289 [Oryza meyeriana var. granulata]|uniref:Uncharacterized protein n=1 Tax=Oryza meyeriana var. granulata TaxID=110450 RepID=A0A6G1EEW7_9ORYZ|nr:hypothetical protein E2562_005289 [Oryza meyeriana var. granulata]